MKKKLEKKGGSRTHKLKRLYKVGRCARVISSDEASLGDQENASKQGRKIDDIDKDAEITLVHETRERYGDEEMFDAGVLDGDEVLAEPKVTIKDVNLSVDEVTLAQALAALKSAKVQEKANVVEEPSESITTTPTLTTTTTAATTIIATSTRPKAKGLVIHEQEQAPTPIVSSQQPLQAKIQNKGKAKMFEPKPMKKLSKKYQLNLDKEVAQRLQVDFDEQERIEKEKAEANITLKETWDDIQAKIEKLFEKAMKRVNTFINMDTELVKESSKKADAEISQDSSSKRAGDELEQESIKKQKVDDDKEIAELKSLMEVIPDEEEVAVDAIPLATKPPNIVDYKIHKEGETTYYHIIRSDGSLNMYLVFSHMLKSFDREDLETLWKLVKAKHGSTRLEEGYERVL
ncbi:hypothetical protein Tco_1033800 [Tanacetum coccineum]